MQRSTDRILTTHTGSLPRPLELSEAILAREQGGLDAAGMALLTGAVRQAVHDAVDRQAAIGFDMVSDGEMSKIGYSTYVKERLSGYHDTEPPEGSGLSIADLDDYPGMAERSLAGLTTTTPVCTGPLRYLGRAELAQDLTTLRDALAAHPDIDGFVSAASPGVIALYLPNKYYDSLDSYLEALAEAMRVEYEAIVAAGFVLQIDAPDLAMGRHIQYAHLSLEEFQHRAEVHVEAINQATRNIDPGQVRVHLCYGNYQGPHHRDVAFRDIVEIVLKLDAQGLAFEAANHRHAHEWQVFAEVPLPADKVIIPGVIDTSSLYVEHPELVAQRIERYAGLVGPERLVAGTDCGFSSFATFPAVSPPELAWAKLAALTEGARIASERLW